LVKGYEVIEADGDSTGKLEARTKVTDWLTAEGIRHSLGWRSRQWWPICWRKPELRVTDWLDKTNADYSRSKTWLLMTPAEMTHRWLWRREQLKAMARVLNTSWLLARAWASASLARSVQSNHHCRGIKANSISAGRRIE